MSDFNYTHDEKNYQIRVKTPYNKDFIAKARNLRGSWDSKAEEWVFDDSIEDYVKAALVDCYGTTGEGIVETCSLLIKNYDDDKMSGPVELFGRIIARAFGRDSGAKLGDDIIWVAGKYKSGGSVKNWRTEVREATFEIQNFPLPRTEFVDVQEAIKEGWCEIKIPKRKRKAEEIQADIEKYEAIIEQLKKELSGL